MHVLAGKLLLPVRLVLDVDLAAKVLQAEAEAEAEEVWMVSPALDCSLFLILLNPGSWAWQPSNLYPTLSQTHTHTRTHAPHMRAGPHTRAHEHTLKRSYISSTLAPSCMRASLPPSICWIL